MTLAGSGSTSQTPTASDSRGVPPTNPLPLDSIGMWEVTLGLPEQIGQAAVAAEEVVASVDPELWQRRFANVAVFGMGGSGVAGDILQALAAPRFSVPVLPLKSYRAPKFVGPETLAFALSCSGDTEETVSAASAAWEAGATVVAVAGGGRLAELAAERGAPLFGVPGNLPQPRAALGAMTVPTLVALRACDLLPEADALIASGVEQLERRREELLGSSSPAPRIASTIGRTVTLVHGGEGPGAVAATRWKTQINENVKAPAFASVQPELCHNEVAGWGQHGDITRQVLTLVALRCPSDHPQVARRIDVMMDLLLEVVHDVVEVWGAGDTDLAQLLDLVLVGDVVSLLLAGQEGVDPGPVPILGEIKALVAG